jgi:hypothetical protein
LTINIVVKLSLYPRAERGLDSRLNQVVLAQQVGRETKNEQIVPMRVLCGGKPLRFRG